MLHVPNTLAVSSPEPLRAVAIGLIGTLLEQTHAQTVFLELGAVGTGLFFVGAARTALARARASRVAIPTVDRLVLTSTIDGSYDTVLPSGPIGTVMVQRTTGTQPSLTSEHGLGFHLESFVGDDRRAILLDFGNTYQNLSRNYQALKIEAGGVDALILSHGHADHYRGFLELADVTPEWVGRRLALYAGGRIRSAAAGPRLQMGLAQAALN